MMQGSICALALRLASSRPVGPGNTTVVSVGGEPAATSVERDTDADVPATSTAGASTSVRAAVAHPPLTPVPIRDAVVATPLPRNFNPVPRRAWMTVSTEVPADCMWTRDLTRKQCVVWWWWWRW